jgi:hypothetical protein
MLGCSDWGIKNLLYIMIIFKKTHIRERKELEKNVRKNQRQTRGRCITMSKETADRMVNTGIADAEKFKIQTADALEEAARKLRTADVSAKGEDFRHILYDVEDRVNQFKAEVGAEYQIIEEDYHKRVEPVEHSSITPFPRS